MFPATPFVVSFVLSVIFASYLSKFLGNATTGCFINFRFPVPPIITLNVIGSLAFTSFLFNWALMLNFPTPPEKLAGRLGSGSTWIVIPGAFIARFTSMYPEPPFKNASNGSTLRFCCITVPLNVMLGISSLPVI